MTSGAEDCHAIWRFPTLVLVSIGIGSACFAAARNEAVAQEPQFNGGQVGGQVIDAQRRMELRTTDSAVSMPTGRASPSKVNPGVDVLTLSGPSESRARRIEKVLASLDKLRTTYRVSGDGKLEAAALLQIGTCYGALGQMQKAIDQYKDALSIWQQLKDSPGEASAPAHIGDVYRLWGFPDRALPFYEESLPSTSLRMILPAVSRLKQHRPLLYGFEKEE